MIQFWRNEPGFEPLTLDGPNVLTYIATYTTHMGQMPIHWTMTPSTKSMDPCFIVFMHSHVYTGFSIINTQFIRNRFQKTGLSATQSNNIQYWQDLCSRKIIYQSVIPVCCKYSYMGIHSDYHQRKTLRDKLAHIPKAFTVTNKSAKEYKDTTITFYTWS